MRVKCLAQEPNIMTSQSVLELRPLNPETIEANLSPSQKEVNGL